MDVEAVLEFLRKNGFNEAESALKEDIIEKGQLDFEKFLFPMVPPPPLLKIPPSSLLSTADDGERSSSGSSRDEFVSVGSSSSEVCSSEFINPYGIRSASKANSETSSDRLSQFGTARDYPDFVLQDESYWYDEKDEGCFMTPSFGASDPFGCPSEDKFVMSSESNKEFVNPMGLYGNMELFQSETPINYMDKRCLFHVASLNDVNVVQETGSYNFDKASKSGGYFKGELEGGSSYDHSVPLCGCYSGASGFYDQGPVDGGSLDPNLTNLSDLQLSIGGKDLEISDSIFELRVNGKSDNFMGGSSANALAGGSKGTSDLDKKDARRFSFPDGSADFEVTYLSKAEKDCHEPEAAMNEEAASVDDHWFYDHEDEYEVFNLRIIHRKNRTGFEENKDLPIMLNTVIAGRYFVTEYLGSAAFSKVVQAHDLLVGVDVCLKIIKNDKDFFDQSLDEIKLLKLVNKHDPKDEWHILRLYDYFYHQEHLFIVCELLRANLYEFQKYNQESGGEPYFTLTRLQVITRQILEALEYLHGLGIIHCDLKPENVVIKSYRRCEIKVIDLGSSCFQTDNLSLYVQSRSYRAPEVILGLPYDQKIDLWSLGCILAELYSGEVLFPNDAIVMILSRIIGILGPIDLDMLEKGQETPKYFTNEYDLYYINEETNQLEYIIPEASSLEQHLEVTDVEFIDFLRYLLEIDPKRRPSAHEALQHPWLAHSY